MKIVALTHNTAQGGGSPEVDAGYAREVMDLLHAIGRECGYDIVLSDSPEDLVEQDSPLAPGSWSPGHRHQTGRFPDLIPEAVARALRAGSVREEDTVVVVNTIAGLPSLGDIREAIARHEAVGAPVVSIRAVRDHPAQLVRHFTALGGDMVALFDRPGPAAGDQAVSKPFFFDWSLYGVAQARGRYESAGRAAETGIGMLRRSRHPETARWTYAAAGPRSARLHVDAGLLARGGLDVAGISVFCPLGPATTLCVRRLGEARPEIWIREEFCDGLTEVRCFPVHRGLVDTAGIARHLLAGDPGRVVDLPRGRYLRAFSLAGDPDSLALLFLRGTDAASMDFSEPLDVDNPFWEIDHSQALRDRRTGALLTGRQQLPSLFMPDGTLAVARARQFPELAGMLRAGTVYGLVLPPRAAASVSGGRRKVRRAVATAGNPSAGRGAPVSKPRTAFPAARIPAVDRTAAASREMSHAAGLLENMHHVARLVQRHASAALEGHKDFHSVGKAYDCTLRRYHGAVNRHKSCMKLDGVRLVSLGARFLAKGDIREGLRLWRKRLATFPHDREIRRSLKEIAGGDTPHREAAREMLDLFSLDLRCEISVAAAQAPNLIVGKPGLPWLFLSDIDTVRKLDLGGRAISSFGANLHKPLVLWLEEDVIWLRDLTPGREAFLAFDLEGNALGVEPVERLVDDPGNMIPMGMCRMPGRNIFLLTNKKTLQSTILAQDARTGKLDVLAGDDDNANFMSFVSGHEGTLFASDSFSRTIMKYDFSEREFRKFVSIPDYGSLRSFVIVDGYFYVATNDALHKFDCTGESIYSVMFDDLLSYPDMKTSGITCASEDGRIFVYLLDRKKRKIFKLGVCPCSTEK